MQCEDRAFIKLSPTVQYRILVMPAFLVICFLLSAHLLMSAAIGGAWGAGLQQIHKNIAGEPNIMSHRMLVPTLSRFSMQFVPEGLKEDITNALILAAESDVGKRFVDLRNKRPKNTLNPDKIFTTFWVLGVVGAITLTCFLIMLYKLARHLFPTSYLYAQASVVFSLLLIPVFSYRYSYSFDFAELFFSCALFYTLITRKWAVYLLLLIVGTLNKPSTIFILIFFLFWFHNKMPRLHYLLAVILQSVLYALTMIWLGHMYGEQGTYNQFKSLFNPSGWLLKNILYVYGYNFYSFISILLSLVLISYKWQEKPIELRYALWMCLANLCAYFVACNPGEYRDLFWSVPFLTMLAAHSIVSLSGMDSLEIFRVRHTKSAYG